MFLNLPKIRYMQYLSVCIATMTISSVSMYGAWPSPTLPILSGPETHLERPITDEEGSWIVSLVSLATPLSCIFAAWLINITGRKGSLLVSSILLLIPWIMKFFAKTAMVIYIARFIAGFAFGWVYTSTAMYSGEVSEVDIRGKVGFIISIMKLLGTFLVLSIGPFVSFDALTLICAAVPIIFFFLMIPMPESPYHLILKGKNEKARDVLVLLSEKSASESFIDKRLLEIEETIRNDMKNKGTLWELISNKEYRSALIISFGLKSLNQFCGVVAIDSYMQTIIGASGSSIPPEISSLLFGIVQIPAAIIATFLVDKLGRKPLLIISSWGCAIAMAGEGIYFYLQDELRANVDSLHWLPTTGILLFLVMNNIGITTVPTVLLSEIFPTNIKGIAISANTCYGAILAFLVSKFFMPLSNAIGMHYVFFIFMTCCILGIFFVVLYMPETKGKTFTEIQIKLNRNYIKDKDVKKENKVEGLA